MNDFSDNISKNFFSYFYQIKDLQNQPLTNIYWSSAHRPAPVFGCLYFIHGYGGSPIEPCLKIPMQYALAKGFDVVAVEGVDMSATATSKKELSSMTLDRQKQAIEAGLCFCNTILNINHDYKVAWIHSISCRALSDLIIDSPQIRCYFDEVVLNNPYFMAPPKVQELQKKLMKRDPSGAMWQTLIRKASTQMRQIEHRAFQIPTCLYNLCIPLPPLWRRFQTFEDLAKQVSRFVRKLRVHFVLGTEDTMADYNQNVKFFNGLTVPYKQVTSINGANHVFDNTEEKYQECARNLIDTIKLRRIGKTK